MRSATARTAVTITAALALLASAGCTGGGSSGTPSATTEAGGLAWYLVDGNMGLPAMSAVPAATLSGVQGTVLGVQATAAFTAQLTQADPGLATTGTRYAPQTYDAVTLIALAAAAAQSNSGAAIAHELPAVSATGASCSSFEECIAKVNSGADIAYRGEAGSTALTAAGPPTGGVVSLFQYDAQGQVPGLTSPANTASPVPVITPSGSPSSATASPSPSASPAGDHPVTIGAVLPLSGSLRVFGRAEAAAARQAVADVNAAGGVFGRPLQLDVVDGGSTVATTDTASQTLLAKGVSAAVAGGAPGLTQPVVAPLTQAGVVVVSPADPIAVQSRQAGTGLVFSMVPTAADEAQVLAGVLARAGRHHVALVSSRTSYGSAMAAAMSTALSDNGVNVVVSARFDQRSASQHAAAQAVAAAHPNAVVVLGASESAGMLKALAAAGASPS